MGRGLFFLIEMKIKKDCSAAIPVKQFFVIRLAVHICVRHPILSGKRAFQIAEIVGKEFLTLLYQIALVVFAHFGKLVNAVSCEAGQKHTADSSFTHNGEFIVVNEFSLYVQNIVPNTYAVKQRWWQHLLLPLLATP
jgi:hypothetical protein